MDRQLLADVSLAEEEDVNRAVMAARRAFEGQWGRSTPFECQAVLSKLADLVDSHFDEPAILDTLDMRASIASMGAKRRRAVGLLRYYAGLK